MYLLKNLDDLSDPSKILHLTKGHTALLNILAEFKISTKMFGLFPRVTFFIGIL